MLVEIRLSQHFLFPGVVGESETELTVDLRLVLTVGLAYDDGAVVVVQAALPTWLNATESTVLQDGHTIGCRRSGITAAPPWPFSISRPAWR